jgi:hypothetical protein
MVQRIEEQLQQAPAGGFLEGLGAGRFEGYKLGYTGGSNPDADKGAIGRAATQQEVVDAKSRCKKKLHRFSRTRVWLKDPRGSWGLSPALFPEK